PGGLVRGLKGAGPLMLLVLTRPSRCKYCVQVPCNLESGCLPTVAEYRGGAVNSADGGALAGLRVLEVAGPLGEYAGKLLAGFGADVVLIEPPGGAARRHLGPFIDDEPGPERSLSFAYLHTSKRG